MNALIYLGVRGRRGMKSLPKGWIRGTISDLGKILSGGTPDTKNPSNWDGDIPWATPTDITSLSGKTIIRTEKTISQQGLNGSSAILIPEDSVLVCTRATLGECAINKIPMATNQGFKNIVPHSGIGAEFTYYAIQLSKKEIIKRSSGSAFLEISGSQLGKIPLNIPPQKERERIVEILSDADAAIAVAKKALRLRQKLFAGLVESLIGRHQECNNWRSVSLADIGRVSSAGVDKKIIVGETPVQLVNYMDVYRLDFITANDVKHQVTAPAPKVSSCNVIKGDIFFTPTSEKRDDIAHSAVALEDIPGAVYSYHVVRLRPTIALNLIFSSYLFKTKYFMNQASRCADGSGQRYVVSLGNFRRILVSLPKIEQQVKIGQTLFECQNEQQKIRSQISKLKKQKQGLMQQLLTGNIRVPGKGKVIRGG